MEICINPARSRWKSLCERVTRENPEIEQRVRAILDRVRQGGDAAVKQITAEIDGFLPDNLKVSESEFAAARANISPKVKKAIDEAYRNIAAFHKAELPSEITVRTAPGVTCIQKPVAINSVGLYIPGGTAPLFSTVLMLGVPSAIAGCPRRIMCTPCGKSGKLCDELLYAAWKCGIADIWKIGGSQAIAAMAYGTGSIPKVDKIFGPGNRYVTTAKQIVSVSGTAIDMPAGPSEVMVLADESARAEFVAADLLSQAEHGRDSQAMLVCTSESFARKVYAEVERQAALLSRREMVEGSLAASRLIVFDDVETVVEFADSYASEHLIISMKNADEIAQRITAAGSVFIGNYTPESAGDYASGTNHTLPTSGWARSFSGVNMDSFMRKMTLQKITREGLKGLSDTIIDMAEAEGLQAHAEAVKVRIAAAAEGEKEAFDPMSAVRSNIAALEPYSTARDDFKGAATVFVDANESPFENGVNRYPDPRQMKLKTKLSQIKGIPVEKLFLGNGSDEAIDLIYRIFCEPGRNNAVAIAPTYGMYGVAARINNVEYREVALEEDFTLDTEKLFAATDGLTKVIFICSPNNPTGNAFPKAQILGIANRFEGMVVVDEAYADFSSEGSVVAEAPANVVVLQTLSKARGMAGLRVGLAIADPRIIATMSSVKYPYNINVTAIAKALELLEQPVDDNVKLLVSERSALAEALKGFSCIKKIYPSDANFLLVKTTDAKGIYNHLTADGIIVRDRSSLAGCGGCLRITVGTPDENKKVIESLSAYEKGNIR